MNGYDLHRMRLNFRFENPDKCRSIHSELFMYIVDLWNRLGQKEKFGLPTETTMELLSIGSYKTYNKAYKDLIERGFIKEIVKSKNQYSSRVIAMVKSAKATDKALDKATIKATAETSIIIDKQGTKNNITSSLSSEYILKTWKQSHDVLTKGGYAGLSIPLRRSEDLEQARKKLEKKGISNEERLQGIRNYVVDIGKRKPTQDYATHRFSLLQFLKQTNGVVNFI